MYLSFVFVFVFIGRSKAHLSHVSAGDHQQLALLQSEVPRHEESPKIKLVHEFHEVAT